MPGTRTSADSSTRSSDGDAQADRLRLQPHERRGPRAPRARVRLVPPARPGSLVRRGRRLRDIASGAEDERRSRRPGRRRDIPACGPSRRRGGRPHSRREPREDRFLSKVEAHELEPTLAQIAGGDFRIDERMALRADILPAGRMAPARTELALNDIVVARGALARVCRLDVAIGPSHLATFIADGLVVASPTGSTGYSFSAGGPIVDPLSRNLIVTPIAGYLTTLRSVVVDPSVVVSCRVLDAHEALVSIDGREDLPIAV